MLDNIQHLTDKIRESTVDYPRPELSPHVWEQVGDGEYRLRDEVKEVILALLDEYPDAELLNIAHQGEGVRIIGSICSNQYTDDTDIDVHIAAPEDLEHPDPQGLQKDVMVFFKDRVFVGEHPIEVYLQLNPAQDMLSVGVYDVFQDEWLKGPLLVPMDYDPYYEFADILDTLRDELGDVDKLIGELRRDATDYETILSALQHLPEDQKGAVLRRLKAVEQEIEDQVRELMAHKKEWVNMRKEASQPVSAEEALEDLRLSQKWLDANSQFKFLSRYNYLKLISDLESMMKDQELSPEEIETMREIL